MKKKRIAAALLAAALAATTLVGCGGGGEAAVLEPQLAAALKRAVKSVLRNGERVLSYSTHCAESLSRAGVPTDHALSALFGLRERPRAGLAQVSSLVKTLVSVAGLGQEKAREAEMAHLRCRSRPSISAEGSASA